MRSVALPRLGCTRRKEPNGKEQVDKGVHQQGCTTRCKGGQLNKGEGELLVKGGAGVDEAPPTRRSLDGRGEEAQ